MARARRATRPRRSAQGGSLPRPASVARWLAAWRPAGASDAPRRAGPIFQTIDAERLRAKNQETWPFFSSVTAALTPTSKSAAKVQFKTFRLLGFVPVTAPDAARGALDTTYVDDELRVSRGDKGNLFVLRQADPAARLPDAAFEAPFALSDALAARSVREFR